MGGYMKQSTKCKNCGCDEFITKPNKYDVYQFIDGKLEQIKSEMTNDEFKLYCRNCAKEPDEKF